MLLPNIQHTATHANPRPALIGVLDSGVGGLSILREIHRAMPAHPTLYYADQAHLPYGVRPNHEIFALTSAITRWMLSRGASMIVLACNAASAGSLYQLRESFPNVPFVGIEPAVKPAAEATKTGIIGVLTTQTTADGELYKQTVQKYASNIQVITQVAGALVHLVERAGWDTLDGRAELMTYIKPMIDGGADHIALACTHFPFLKDAIAEITGDAVITVDPAPAVARQTRRVLASNDQLVHERGEAVQHEYFTSGSATLLSEMLLKLTGVDANVNQLKLDI